MNKLSIQNIGLAMMLAMLVISGAAMAQNDTPFVIKKGDNYLAHVKVENDYELQASTTFNPSTCLWYSGPTYNPTGYTHNYYFEDDAHNLRFLAAPLYPDTTLSLSNSLPSVSMLRNTDQVYYFYNWDPETHLNGVPEGGGVARGKRYYVNTAEECHACGTPPGATWYETNTTNHTYQCWEVYWIEYSGSEWKLSDTSSYNITTNAARYRKVTVTEHEKEITAGGLTTLTVPSEMNFQENPLSSAVLSALVGSPYSYIPAYANYVFLENGSESVHNYWGNTDHGGTPPGAIENVAIGSKNYQWTISGDGVEYLSFNSGSDVNTSTDESPTLYYRVPNNTGHKMATITVTVTYTAQNEQTTQTRSATVLVKTPCGNPSQAAAPVVTYTGVTVSWAATAAKYKVDWKKHADENYGTPVEVIGASSYTIIGLDYQTQYDYRVTAYCGENYETPPTSPTGTFTTKAEPGLLVNGAIFGGGRMANVGGKTEIVVVNCDSIGEIFGGNDIAGEVVHSDGSTIMLGVESGDATYGTYGTTTDTIKLGSVYGGGNGYYAYNGTSFVAATSSYTQQTVPAGSSVKAMTQAHTVGDVVWTNTGSSSMTLDFPKIVKTAITVRNDYVKADSIFGGAKNAFLTQGSGNGSTITIDGGTIMAVFGGNNFGGGQGYGKHYIEVNGTKTKLALNIQNTATKGYGRDFGIRYLFGGGNKVYGSTTDIRINGGQCDNVFGGGNSADVYQANVTVNCALGAYSSNYTFGNTYTNAIPTSYQSGAISIKDDYEWDGKDIYNVRNLYGGNNMEHMASVPTVTLTSGSVGTVYGGGNAGDMLASSAGSIDEDDDNSTPAISFNYSTKVILNSANIIADYLYGGCRMSNVDYSTWVQIQNGHVGTVFGGCNVSGDVGSTRVNPSAASGTEAFQEVQGGTYVEASGGTVYKNLFAGGNGFYHCNNLFHYVSGINYTDENHVGMLVPSHNETYANVRSGATIKGNVYAGGNLAPVGFQDQVASYFPSFPTDAVGWAVVHIYGGTIEGNVFGGGNMADVYGSNDVLVAGGRVAAVYGGNDRTGQVAEYSNRVLPPEYSYATDGSTMLVNPGPEVHAYVRVVGNPTIDEVYGGGNGDYDYENGDEVVHQYCDENESGPIQSNTFVDIHIDGGENGGHIGTVYGGGDGVTASGFITVFMNIVEPNPAEDYVNVNTVFGGNNKGDLDIVPNIILLHGQVGTVYGGCNEGAMTAATGVTVGDYANIGSYVHLRNEYRPNGTGTPVTPTAKVTEAVYGGCRMNGVTRNSLVLVEHGDFSTMTKGIFGGSDISGTVSDTSWVAVTGGTVGNVFGGGNGDYYYDNNNVYPNNDHSNPIATGTSTDPITPPYSATSRVDMISGTAGNLYAGGNACGSGTTVMQVEGGTVNSGVYGGSNASGTITGDIVVNIVGGTIGANTNTSTRANIHGGGFGSATASAGNVTVNIATTGATTGPTINGDIYGGSALGQVSANGYLTQVNFYKGTINGDVYGGGLGNIDHAAEVSGDVEVNIRGGVFNSALGTVAGGGSIYGCNNANGTPLGNVNVNIYATDHGSTPQTNAYPSTIPTGGWNATTLAANTALPQAYAIGAVYGGGNQAAYAPSATGKSATVHVYNCDNTIKNIFGGGNAANVGTLDADPTQTGNQTITANTNVIIDGGRIKQVFGGGNGAGVGNPGANIYGTATTTLYAGLIDQVFGGSNERGDITTTHLIVGHDDNNTCDAFYSELFGGGNLAEISGDLITDIQCGVGYLGDFYGGANQASIKGNVTLNVYGGTYNNVYGGSKGVAGGTAADIKDNTATTDVKEGNVTLNLYGGTIGNAFGGSNQNGNIEGIITVNVLDYEDCALNVTNLYGAGNVTAYTPNDVTSGVKPISPVVNVMHVKNSTSSIGNVFGGAYGASATVTSNPQVTIGYASGMSSYIPQDYYTATPSTLASADDLHAMVSGNVYGGGDLAPVVGNTTVSIQKANSSAVKLFGGGNQANVSAATNVNMYEGSVSGGVYGGCNDSGTIGGNIAVTMTGGTVGASGTGNEANIHGGGYGSGTSTSGDVTVTIGTAGGANSDLAVYGAVYGGSALGSVNNASANPKNTTRVWMKSGTVNGRVYGGGLGDDTHSAVVNGNVQVQVDGGNVTRAVYGCNDQKGAPTGTVTVNMSNGTVTNLVGGGNQADYAGTPSVLISGGTVLNRVIGGANAANVGGTSVSISGGTHFRTGNLEGRGVYGGCNDSGTVEGNVLLDITGGTFGSQAIINQDAANETVSVNIHGGGYGESTAVSGNVTVNYGDNTNTHNPNLKLYGDLYGGSALGSVNTNDANTTMVNVRNGSFGYAIETISVMVNGESENVDIQYGGNVYGGGLGQKAVAAGTDPITGNPTPAIPGIEATVNGTVYVNVGAVDATSATGYSGLANLEHCNVYGCNNLNGSPQSDVYVKVYQTYHTANNVVGEDGFAIGSVYGGGNEADYRPAGTTTAPIVNDNHTIITPGTGPRTHIYVYSCENSVNYIYGGSNAAFAVGTVVIVEGGHFGDIFGGGNGLLVVADIGSGGVGMNVLAGTINYQYEGSNLNGGNLSGINYIADASDFNACPGGLQVETYFFGANEAVTYGTLKNIIECSDAGDFNYTNVFAGSRCATIYGDLRLTVRGGTITNLYGGSQGYPTKPAHVRRFPTQDEITNGNYIHGTVSQAMLDHLEAHPEDYGTGGNVILTVEGGTIENVFGGNQVKGNIDGSIIIIVDSTQLECPLSVGTIYAASDRADYQPFEVTDATGTHEPQTPFVYVKNGTVTGNIYGGCKGEINSETGAVIGHTYSNPVTVIGNIASGTNNKSKVGGSVFAGGYIGNVSGDTRVVLQGKATVNQNVYGGGYLGDVDGETNVVLTPTTHTLTVIPPTHGTIKVNSENTSSMLVGENSSIHVEAIPADGYVFSGWTVSGTGAWLNSTMWAVTVFNMGTGDATITATFVPKPNSKKNR